MGVNIKCLFWADDVVLLANNEQDLQCMLNIAAEFSHKWHLSLIMRSLMYLLQVNV